MRGKSLASLWMAMMCLASIMCSCWELVGRCTRVLRINTLLDSVMPALNQSLMLHKKHTVHTYRYVCMQYYVYMCICSVPNPGFMMSLCA